MQAITATGGCNSPSIPQPRLVQAAHEFEAQLMKELLRPLATSSEGDGAEDGAEGTLSSFASEALGQSLSRSGGFGISASILRSLSRNGNNEKCNPVKGSDSDLSGRR
ncbi:MAG TPA: hypothetical protein VGF82_14020 [Terracidiphilus sp.]|jgi:Rod binding domain-containing protein